MDHTDRLKTICREHTLLTADDIDTICRVAEHLQLVSDLAQANVFIDCPTKDNQHAVVVAERSPLTGLSLYSDSVVGQFAYESYEPAVVRTHKSGKPTIRNRAITQEGKSVKQSVVPIKNKQGHTIGSLIMEQDISAQIMHEHQIKILNETTEQLSETLLGITEQEPFISDMIQEALFLVDPNGFILYANAYAINLIVEMGGSSDVVGVPIKHSLTFLKGIDLQTESVLFREMNSGRKTFAVKGVLLRKNQQTIGSLISIRDLTELREKERQLMVKSTVIKEIHHRVKNNLQAVASLLRLQMRRGVPAEAERLFQESLNRILSIAAVHDILSNTGLDEVEVLQMVKKVGLTIVNNGGDPERHIEINFVGDQIQLQTDKAVSLALVVNELIQNSVDHAFPNQSHGVIKVSIVAEDELVNVSIEDNGVGYSLQNGGESLGLQIVKTLTEQDLSGTFSIECVNNSTVALVKFPLHEEGNDATPENIVSGR